MANNFNITGDDPVNTRVRYNSLLDASFDEGTVTEPVTPAEAKDFCKIDTGTVEDSLILAMITQARQQCEDFTGISIIPKTVTALVCNLNGGIFLPYCPFVTLTSIKDSDGNAIPTGDYTISGTRFPQLIAPKWDRIELVYTAGYGTTKWPLLQEIKQAILQQVFYLYNNRGETAEQSRNGTTVQLTLSPQARATLQRLRRV